MYVLKGGCHPICLTFVTHYNSIHMHRHTQNSACETDILYSIPLRFTLTISLPKGQPWLSSLYWVLLLPCLSEV